MRITHKNNAQTYAHILTYVEAVSSRISVQLCHSLLQQ